MDKMDLIREAEAQKTKNKVILIVLAILGALAAAAGIAYAIYRLVAPKCIDDFDDELPDLDDDEEDFFEEEIG